MSWDRWNEVQVWRDRLDRLANPHRETWAPAVDVYETRDSYVVMVELPGLKRDQIDVELEAERLTIRGERADQGAISGAVVHYHQVERGHGSFARTFEFVEQIDTEHVAADLANGVLSVTLRKLPSPPARRITVK